MGSSTCHCPDNLSKVNEAQKYSKFLTFSVCVGQLLGKSKGISAKMLIYQIARESYKNMCYESFGSGYRFCLVNKKEQMFLTFYIYKTVE